MNKIKLILSSIVGGLVVVLSAISYVLFRQAKDERAHAKAAETTAKDLSEKLEAKNEFDNIEREAAERAQKQHSSLNGTSSSTAELLHDMHNHSSTRVRSHK